MKDKQQLIQLLVGPPSSPVSFGAIGTSAPSAITDGISCKGIGKMDLTLIFSNSAQSGTFRIWLMDANGEWQNANGTTAVTAVATRVCTDPFDTHSYDRIYIQETVAPGAGTWSAEGSPKGLE